MKINSKFLKFSSLGGEGSKREEGTRSRGARKGRENSGVKVKRDEAAGILLADGKAPSITHTVTFIPREQRERLARKSRYHSGMRGD